MGDSRTVIAEVQGGSPSVALATRDHTPSAASEIKRITSAGGHVHCVGGDWRVTVDSPEGQWQVGVARALGGTEWNGAGISDTADVSAISLSALRDGFVVLASDGIWGALDGVGEDEAQRSEEVVNLVFRQLNLHGKSASEVAQELNERASRAGGNDNKCTILIRL